MIEFETGDEIVFVHTGARGRIDAIYPDGMFKIWLYDDREHIPAFGQDIVLEGDFQGIIPNENAPKKKHAGKPKFGGFSSKSTADLFFSAEELDKLNDKYDRIEDEPKHKAKDSASPVTQSTSLPPLVPTDTGLHLLLRQVGSEWTFYLINDLPQGFAFRFVLLDVTGQASTDLSLSIGSHDYFAVASCSHSQMINQPECQLTIAAFQYTRSLKIKAKQLTKQVEHAPLAGLSGALITIFQQVPELKPSVLSAAKMQRKEPMPETGIYHQIELDRIAKFPLEIDLHIEKLVPDPTALSAPDALKAQLYALENYLEEAILLGIKKVYIIHGVGKGRLKEEVARIASQNPHVVSFRNEWFAQYGYGATEVVISYE